LLRGVSLGLFDEAAAMQKFTAWSVEHDAHIARRQGAHRKARIDSKNQPVVRKVADAPVVESTPALEADAAEETKTEE
jgi:small subunit ribosomal protein S16